MKPNWLEEIIRLATKSSLPKTILLITLNKNCQAQWDENDLKQ